MNPDEYHDLLRKMDAAYPFNPTEMLTPAQITNRNKFIKNRERVERVNEIQYHFLARDESTKSEYLVTWTGQEWECQCQYYTTQAKASADLRLRICPHVCHVVWEIRQELSRSSIR